MEGLGVRYATERGMLTALDGVSFTIAPGRALGLVGESGSGKSTALLALLGLLGPEASVTARSLRFKGASLLGPTARIPRGDRIRT